MRSALLVSCATALVSADLESVHSKLKNMNTETFLDNLVRVRDFAIAEHKRRGLDEIDTSDFTGLRLNRDDAVIELGENGDVQMYRPNDGTLIFTSKRRIVLKGDVEATGDLGFGGNIISNEKLSKQVEEQVYQAFHNITSSGRIACEEGWKGPFCAKDGQGPTLTCNEKALIIKVNQGKNYGDLKSTELSKPSVVDNGPITSETDCEDSLSFEFLELEDDVYSTTNAEGVTIWRLNFGKKYKVKWSAQDSFGNVGTCTNTYRVGAGCQKLDGSDGCPDNTECVEDGEKFTCECKAGYFVNKDGGCSPTVCDVKVYLQGAGGASGNYGGWSWGGDGGAGAFSRQYFKMPFGHELLIVAGEGGKPFQNNFFNIGGGGPVSRNKGDNRYCGGGGGASGVWYLTGTNAKTREATRQITQAEYSKQFTQESTIVMAGAGGGGGAMSGGSRDYMWGGAGGTSNGQNAAGNGYYGKGGTQTGCQGNNGGGGQCGVKFSGGAGSPGDSYGGGGGGGWWGGSGAQHTNPMAGGGGGSSRISACSASQGCPAVSGATWVAGSRLNKGQDPEKSSHWNMEWNADQEKMIKKNPVEYWFDGVGQGGTGNGRPGENGRVIVVVNGDHKVTYESGSHIFKCNTQYMKPCFTGQNGEGGDICTPR